MEAVSTRDTSTGEEFVDYCTEPSAYKHWKLTFEGSVATLIMDTKEDGGIRPGYKLKLNSYDLGVDIELHDALQRIRFEHPGVGCVVLTSGKSRVFCSGANIYMLGLSSHAWKVNFCKFTNETRNGMEDSSAHSGLRFIAACNGSTAGGGYELALACDEIILVDDRSSAVSLPEVPLLGVLPGTGGLTRLTDKRRVRKDHADVFCTISEGLQGQRAKDWRLVDAVVKPQDFSAYVAARAESLAKASDRPTDSPGVALTPLSRVIDEKGYHYEFVDVELHQGGSSVTFTIRAPHSESARSLDQILNEGARWWPLQMARELDDAILLLRTNQAERGLWILKTTGNQQLVLQVEQAFLDYPNDWFVREVLGMMRRTFARVEVTSRSIFAVVDEDSCFTGCLLELALAADRIYMLDRVGPGPALRLSAMNFGSLPMANGLSRLEARFYRDHTVIDRLKPYIGQPIDAREALSLGLATFTPDELDWADELRQAIEGRIALSPDALTGLEANLRFGNYETMVTRIFGRLSAWQNWIFIRPNAVGPTGALKVYGKGDRAKFNPERV